MRSLFKQFMQLLPRYPVTPILRYGLLLSALVSLLCALPVDAAVTAASLSNYTIPYETIGAPLDTTINYTTADEISSIEINIHRLEDISEEPSSLNQVASIQQHGVAIGAHSYLWNALWLVGGDIGRQNGNFQVILIARGASGVSSFTIPKLLEITSVDIHNFSVIPSTDANQNPTLPYYIVYDLAKDSLVTVQIKDSSGTLKRTLATDAPQYGEHIKTNILMWDGLGDDAKPVPLGIYTVYVDAKDPGSADRAIQRSGSIAIQSLARLGSSLDQLFADNAIVFPNPIRNSQATFQFLAVRNNANITLKIYTLAGDLVREESFLNQATGNTVTFNWDTTNEAGNAVGRGVYYFVVREEDPEGTVQTIKKLAVIR